MKKIQSVLFAVALAISLSSTVLAGNIHADRTANGNILADKTVTVSGDITGLLTWGNITDVVVSIFGNIHV